jgi:hypothetical protein
VFGRKRPNLHNRLACLPASENNDIFDTEISLARLGFAPKKPTKPDSWSSSARHWLAILEGVTMPSIRIDYLDVLVPII